MWISITCLISRETNISYPIFGKDHHRLKYCFGTRDMLVPATGQPLWSHGAISAFPWLHFCVAERLQMRKTHTKQTHHRNRNRKCVMFHHQIRFNQSFQGARSPKSYLDDSGRIRECNEYPISKFAESGFPNPGGGFDSWQRQDCRVQKFNQ